MKCPFHLVGTIYCWGLAFSLGPEIYNFTSSFGKIRVLHERLEQFCAILCEVCVRVYESRKTGN